MFLMNLPTILVLLFALGVVLLWVAVLFFGWRHEAQNDDR